VQVKKLKASLTEDQWRVVLRALRLIEVEDVCQPNYAALAEWAVRDREVMDSLCEQLGFERIA
jgi:hypothetical protein